MNIVFNREWDAKVKRVRSCKFWKQITSPPTGAFEANNAATASNEVRVDKTWSLATNDDILDDGPVKAGIEDFKGILNSNFGIRLKTIDSSVSQPYIKFLLKSSNNNSRWENSFILDVSRQRIIVSASSEVSLLQASLYLTNYWRLRRSTCLKIGKITIKPKVKIHIGADFWGGFSTTQAWVNGRETDKNFIELARMGINAVPIMASLDDYIETAPKSFKSLINPRAAFNRRRLAQLAEQASKYGVFIFLMAYNPKLEPNHPVFKAVKGSAGALQADSAFRVLCSSHKDTRKFLTDSWASLFEKIPQLGGILALTGGEGFYHCFMRSDHENAADCPRCRKQKGSEAVAELINDVAKGIRCKNPQARLITWPYSAGHWSHDRDQVEFINRLDSENVIFQTEFDKDSVNWRDAGYGKYCWDYSAGCIKASDRCRSQRKLCKQNKIAFSCKLEINNSIECLSVPYLPVLMNHAKVWQDCISLKPQSIHSRWMFDGACKSASEELGYWAIWGDSSEYNNVHNALKAIAQRDFGIKTAPHVLLAWSLFSKSIQHHPSLDYYIGSYFIGPGQPLLLKPTSSHCDFGPAWEFHKLQLQSDQKFSTDEAFFGKFYWLWEVDSGDDASSFTSKKQLFYDQPGFKAIVRRGPKAGFDVALDELRKMAALWEKGTRILAAARSLVPEKCLPRYQQEFILAQHLAYTWRSAANVEEFLRLRNMILEHSTSYVARNGYLRENLRDLGRMQEIAKVELEIAKEDLDMIKGVDFLDLSLRLDMGTASLETIMRAKIKQVSFLLKQDIPQWREQLRAF